MAEVFETCDRWRVVWVDDEGNAYYRDFPTRDAAADFARTMKREHRASKAEMGD